MSDLWGGHPPTRNPNGYGRNWNLEEGEGVKKVVTRWSREGESRWAISRAIRLLATSGSQRDPRLLGHEVLGRRAPMMVTLIIINEHPELSTRNRPIHHTPHDFRRGLADHHQAVPLPRICEVGDAERDGLRVSRWQGYCEPR
jgi:hypothetical protein